MNESPIIGVKNIVEVVNRSIIPMSYALRLCVRMGRTMNGVRELKRLMIV